MSWPKSRATLRGDRNQCTGCGELFNSTAAFDKHRTGDHGKNRRCLTQEEMTAKGMHKGQDQFWRASSMPQDVLKAIIDDDKSVQQRLQAAD